MDTNRIPKQALQYKPKERRHIGRPRKRWRDQFHFEDTRNRNQTYSFLNIMMVMRMMIMMIIISRFTDIFS
jgi:hypothetical protein